MTTSASEIDALKEEIEVLKCKRNKLERQRDGVTDEAKQTVLDNTAISNEIIAISNEIISINYRITATLTSQQQGKFPLSFSFFSR